LEALYSHTEAHSSSSCTREHHKKQQEATPLCSCAWLLVLVGFLCQSHSLYYRERHPFVPAFCSLCWRSPVLVLTVCIGKGARRLDARQQLESVYSAVPDR